jgi:hypothetical protein
MRVPLLTLMLLCSTRMSLAGAQFDLEQYGLNAPAIRLEPCDVTFWFRNNGDETYSGVLHAELFFSADDRLDLDDKLLAQRNQSYEQFPLGPGFQTTLGMSLQIPDVPPGRYYFILTLKLDAISPAAVYVAPFEVLAPDFLVYDFGPNTAISMSAPAQVTWVLKNTGTGYSTGTHLQRLFYSTDASLGGDDIFLAEVSSTNQLNKDFSARFFADFRMPGVVPRGYFIIQVDAPNNISELDEQNNTFAFPLPPQKELAISQTPNTLLFSWNASYGDQRIEFSEMSSSFDWQTVTAPRTLSNGYYQVEIPKPSASYIYRLRIP